MQQTRYCYEKINLLTILKWLEMLKWTEMLIWKEIKENYLYTHSLALE